MGANFNLAKGWDNCIRQKLEYDYIQLKYYRRKIQFSYGLNVKVKLKYWDNEKKVVKLSLDYPQSKAIRQKMKLYADKVEQFAFEIEAEGLKLTKQLLRAKMDAFFQPDDSKEKEEKNTIQLKEYLSNYIVQKRGKVQIGKRPPKSNYERLETNLIEFEKYSKREMLFESINRKFIIDFINFSSSKKEHSINYTAKLLSTLKTVLRDSRADDLHFSQFYESSSFALKQVQTESVYSSLEELDLMYNTNIGIERLDNVRRAYINACYSGGVRYGDLVQIRKENVKEYQGHKYFTFLTEKTNQRVLIPLHKNVEEICEYYNWDIPPPISNTKMNLYLKEVGEAVGLNEETTLLKNKSGKTVPIKKPKYQWLSTKIARKSFATNTYLANWPTKLIMAITGHRSEAMLRKYIVARSLEYLKMINKDNHLYKLGYKAKGANENLI